MVKSPKIEIFENFEKSAPSKIENLVEISVFFNEMVIRPTNKVQETHLWYWFFKPDRLVKVSDFFKWFQSDFFKNRLKLEFFWVLLLCCPVQYCTVLYSTVQYCTVLCSTGQYCTVLCSNRKGPEPVRVEPGRAKKIRNRSGSNRAGPKK